MALPYLGLGLSSNAQRTDSPRPYALLDAAPGSFDYLEYSAPLDVEEARRHASLFATMEARRAQVPLVYHPVHLNLFGAALEAPERLALAAAHVRAVGSPWVSNDVGWWHHGGAALPGYLYLTPPLTAEALGHAVAHVAHVRAAMPVPLLVENPVVMTARGALHVMDFMTRLSDETGCPLLVDLGHLASHQLSRGLPLLEGLHDVPWARVAQLHLAGGVVTWRGGRGVYADDHPQPLRDEVWSLFEALAPRCTALRAVTYEGDGHPDALAARVLRRLRATVRPPTAAEREAFASRPSDAVATRDGATAAGAVGRVSAAGPGAPGRAAPSTQDVVASRPGGAGGATDLGAPPTSEPRRAAPTSEQLAAAAWQLFDDVHAARCEEDPVGAEAELDFRLAVLREQLDAEVPLSRLAVAPGRSELARFVASPAFRGWFEAGTRSLGDAFLGWAMTAARAPERQGADALVSLELWARTTLARAQRGGAATTEATFPVDLGEALHAAQALSRHVAGRAAIAVEAGAWDGLLQCARRAGPGPWRVTLASQGARVVISEAGPGHALE